ncbi:hypothetical protein RCC89_19465 [Cytophagaceae bacterium ABcell3]|nr:hypothetical protein RCC89_19465 [Cytophagaceae bacterium ABcell3]
MKNDPTGGKAENAGGGGDGGDGGGGEKASDGTGASDREGRDIVKVNNVSYETWKGKDGAIYAQKVEDVETGKGHSKVPVNKIANKAEREAIQSHWDTSAQESENMDTGNDPSDIAEDVVDNPIVEDVVIDEIEIPEVAPTKPANPSIQSGSSEEVSPTQAEKTEKVSDKVKDYTDPASGVTELLEDAGEYHKKKTQNEIKNKTENAPKGKKFNPKQLLKELDSIEKYLKPLRNINKAFDAKTIIETVMDLVTDFSPRSIVNAIVEAVGIIASAITGFLSGLVNVALEVFKQTDLFQSMKKLLENFIDKKFFAQ